MLCVASVVFYASKDGARRHPWVVGPFCGRWQADISYPLTTGHGTEQPHSKHHLIRISSSSARLGHTHHETHNVSVKVGLAEVFSEVNAMAKEAVGPR